jgi:hypothetical protein
VELSRLATNGKVTLFSKKHMHLFSWTWAKNGKVGYSKLSLSCTYK